MSEQTLDYFLDHAEAFDALSEGDKAALFAGQPIEVADQTTQDTDTESQEDAGAAEGEDEAKEETRADTAETADTAKAVEADASSQELIETREAARQLREAAEQLHKSVIEAEPVPASQEAAKEAPEPIDVQQLLKQASEAILDGNAEKAAELQAKAYTEVQRQAIESASRSFEQRRQEEKAQESANAELALFETQVGKVLADFPFLDSTSPQKNDTAIELVVAQRDRLIASGLSPHAALAKAAETVVPLFQVKTAADPAPVQTAADLAAKAAAIIANTKPKAPTSLSEVPTGSAAPHDEASAVLEANGINLINKFHGKSQQQIMELMSRVL